MNDYENQSRANKEYLFYNKSDGRIVSWVSCKDKDLPFYFSNDTDHIIMTDSIMELYTENPENRYIDQRTRTLVELD